MMLEEPLVRLENRKFFHIAVGVWLAGDEYHMCEDIEDVVRDVEEW